jgi:hypothetical protein
VVIIINKIKKKKGKINQKWNKKKREKNKWKKNFKQIKAGFRIGKISIFREKIEYITRLE